MACLPSDFKKKGGYLRSIELSRQYDLYRQDYCGCVFQSGNAIKGLYRKAETDILKSKVRNMGFRNARRSETVDES